MRTRERNHVKRRSFKICLLGDGAVGKTSLRRSFLGEGFNEAYTMSIGADFAVKTVSMDGERIVCQIWDLAGQPRFMGVREIYYRGTQACLLVYDITKPESFKNIASWVNELTRNNGGALVPTLLIGNKADLRGTTSTSVLPGQGTTYAENLGEWIGFEVPFIETSAKYGDNVQTAFQTLIKHTIQFYATFQM